eukprot:GEMP01000852.1.p1 GENE.GEMP01000852.1~~GEMP01000852.1.p1  ORF type:complete len:1722 (+),score=472.13 GEMP01000852.1:35-5200(+)
MASRKKSQKVQWTRPSFAMSLNPEAYCKAVLGVDPTSRRFRFIEPWLDRLPEPWQVKCDDRREIFFWNGDSGKSSWDHPYTEAFLNMVKSFDRIAAAHGDSRRKQIDDELRHHHIRLEERIKGWRQVPGDPPYFYHDTTKETRWDDPRTSVVSELNLVIEALTGLDDTASLATRDEKAQDATLPLEDGEIENKELTHREIVRAAATASVPDDAQELAPVDTTADDGTLRVRAFSPDGADVSEPPLAGTGDVAEGATSSELDGTTALLPILPTPPAIPEAAQRTPAIPEAAQTMPAIPAISLDTVVEADDAASTSPVERPRDGGGARVVHGASEKGASRPAPVEISTHADAPPPIPTDPESLPVFRWMIPEAYLLHLGLECPRMACFLLLRPIVLLDLPLPWIAKLDQHRVYFVHRGRTMDSMSWRHPLERFFCTLLDMLRSHFSLTAMPLKDTLVTSGVKMSLLTLLETLGGFEEDFGQWSWVQSTGMFERADSSTRTDDAVKSAQSEVIARLHALKLLWDHCVEDDHFPIPVNEWIQYADERVKKSAVKHQPINISAVTTSQVIQSLTFVYTRAIFCAMQLEPHPIGPLAVGPETPQSMRSMAISITLPPWSRCTTPSMRMEIRNDSEDIVAQALLEEAYENSAPRVERFIAEECARIAVTECSARAMLWFRPISPRKMPEPLQLPKFPELVQTPVEPMEFVTRWYSRAQKTEDVELATKQYLGSLYERCSSPPSRGTNQVLQWAATLREKLSDDPQLDVIEEDLSAPRPKPWAYVEVPDMPPTALRGCIVWGSDEEVETTDAAGKPRRIPYKGAALILPFENSPGCAARAGSPEGLPIPAYAASISLVVSPRGRTVDVALKDKEVPGVITHTRSRSVEEKVSTEERALRTPRSARDRTRILVTPRWPTEYRPLMTRKSIMHWLTYRKPNLPAAFNVMSQGQGRVTKEQYRSYCEQNDFPLDIDFSFHMLDIHCRGELTPFEILKREDALVAFREDQHRRRDAHTCVDDVYGELMFEIMEDEARKCTDMALTSVLKGAILQGLRPPKELPPPEFFENLEAVLKGKELKAAELVAENTKPSMSRMASLELSLERSRAGSIDQRTPRRPSTPMVERDVVAEFEALKRIYHSLSFQEQQILVRKLQPVHHHQRRRKPFSQSPSSTSRLSAPFQHIVDATAPPVSTSADRLSTPDGADTHAFMKVASQTATYGAEAQAFTKVASQTAPCGAEAESPKQGSPARRASYWINESMALFADKMTDRETILFEGILNKTLVPFVQGYATDHVARERKKIEAEEFRRSLPSDCRKIVKTQVFQTYAHLFRRPRSSQKQERVAVNKPRLRRRRSPQMGAISPPPTYPLSERRQRIDDGEGNLFPPEDIRIAPATPVAPEPQISLVVDRVWSCDARNDDLRNRICSDPEDVIEAGYESPMWSMASPVSAHPPPEEEMTCWTENHLQRPPSEQLRHRDDAMPPGKGKCGQEHHRLWSGKGPSAPHSFRGRPPSREKYYDRGAGLLHAARERRRTYSVNESRATSPLQYGKRGEVRPHSASRNALWNSAHYAGARERVDSMMHRASVTPTRSASEILSETTKELKHLRAAGTEGARKPRGRQKPHRKMGALGKKRQVPLGEAKPMRLESRKGTPLDQDEDPHSAKWYQIRRARLRAEIHQTKKQFEETVLGPLKKMTGEPVDAAVDELTRIYQESLLRYSEVCDSMISEWRQR